MATPFELGQKETMQSLDAWEDVGWGSMQEMSAHMGEDILQELAHAEEEADRNDLSPRSRQGWQDHVEFFKGMLSRLD